MTNLDPKKNQKNELTEEQLDKVTGGATRSGTEEEVSADEISTENPDDMVGFFGKKQN